MISLRRSVLARGAVLAIEALLRMVVERRSARVRSRGGGVIYALRVLHDLSSAVVVAAAVARRS